MTYLLNDIARPNSPTRPERSRLAFLEGDASCLTTGTVKWSQRSRFTTGVLLERSSFTAGVPRRVSAGSASAAVAGAGAGARSSAGSSGYSARIRVSEGGGGGGGGDCNRSKSRGGGDAPSIRSSDGGGARNRAKTRGVGSASWKDGGGDCVKSGRENRPSWSEARRANDDDGFSSSGIKRGSGEAGSVERVDEPEDERVVSPEESPSARESESGVPRSGERDSNKGLNTRSECGCRETALLPSTSGEIGGQGDTGLSPAGLKSVDHSGDTSSPKTGVKGADHTASREGLRSAPRRRPQAAAGRKGADHPGEKRPSAPVVKGAAIVADDL
jgi:hypothetical protein